MSRELWKEKVLDHMTESWEFLHSHSSSARPRKTVVIGHGKDNNKEKHHRGGKKEELSHLNYSRNAGVR
ncbi:hypothetical protein D5086_014589 [Populus alba]|uniref:Uncharacterized protein n=1 Tax=Populus alba TaxID=43335 RepID=A0ACC4BXX8_POPAL